MVVVIQICLRGEGIDESGPTYLFILALLYKQKHGGNALLVDAEHAFDPDYSRALGVDVENLIVCQPDNGEMALESTLLMSFYVAFVSVVFLSQVRKFPMKYVPSQRFPTTAGLNSRALNIKSVSAVES